jgi:3-hydroxy acid dehydrogenase/malonic semialdehyde reductase
MIYKTVLVTGASSGIGKAVAELLAEKGVTLVLLARRRDKLIELSQVLHSKTSCYVCECDLANIDSISAAIDNIPQDFSNIDGLINCAGAALGLGTAQEADWSDWQAMININCMGLAYLTQRLLPRMVAKNKGHIINIGSIAGNYPYKGGNVYAASKAFVQQLTLNIKADLLGTAVRVSNIEPGMVADSEFSLVRFKGNADKASAVYEGIEALSSVDIANTVLWVLTQPAHVNINTIELMSINQAPQRTAYHKSIS